LGFDVDLVRDFAQQFKAFKWNYFVEQNFILRAEVLGIITKIRFVLQLGTHGKQQRPVF
jgi:hypothetical protein